MLALDYDRTIARDGVLDPEVRAAIAEVCKRGIAVVIVTGRILTKLEQVAEFAYDTRNPGHGSLAVFF